MGNEEIATTLRELADEIEQDDEHELSKDEAVQRFLEDHPNFVAETCNTKLCADNYGYVGYNVSGESPGNSNVGGCRSTAEKDLKEAGYRISIEMIEEAEKDKMVDLIIKFDVEEINL